MSSASCSTRRLPPRGTRCRSGPPATGSRPRPTRTAITTPQRPRRSGPSAAAVRRRRIQLARRDRANARNAPRSGVGCRSVAGMEPDGDPRPDGRRCVSGGGRVVAATQGVPMRTRVVLALLVVALTVAGCGSSIAPVSVSVSPVEPSPAGASEVTAAPPPAGATTCRLREMRTAIGKPACAPARCRRRVPCRRVRRWRRSPSVAGSLRVSTRTRTCSASGTRLPGNWRASTSTSHARSRGRSSATPTASSCECSIQTNENPCCSPARSTWWCGPTRSPVSARSSSISPRCTTKPTRKSSP